MATEKMVKAGRAGLTFGGDWNEAVEYERLTGVRYDNKLFFSKKPVPIGTIPEDGEYWFLAYEGLTDSEWESILNGTQQVGDSAKLGGKDASEYAKKTELETLAITRHSGYTVDEINSIYNSLHAEVSNGEWYRARVHHSVSHPILGGGTWYVEGYRHSETYGWQTAIGQQSNTAVIYKRSAENGTWTEWNGYLPLSGGTVGSGTVNNPLAVKGAFRSILKYTIADGTLLGELGFDSDGKPIFYDSAGLKSTILHTGNKPSGSYIGNGDATERIINIGGIGSAVILYSSLKRRMAIVTRGLTLCVDENGAVTADFGTDLLDMSTSLKLSIASTHVCLNENGTAYGYLVV